MRLKDLPSRKALAQWLPKGAIGCELGVKRGDHAILLHHHSQPKELHLIDIWREHPKRQQWINHKAHVQEIFAGEIQSKQVFIHEGKGADILPQFADGYFDWLYIDARHDYNSVIQDINLACQKVKKGGIIAGHDFHSAPYAYGTGVIRAVINNIQDGKLKMLAITNEHKPDWVCQNL